MQAGNATKLKEDIKIPSMLMSVSVKRSWTLNSNFLISRLHPLNLHTLVFVSFNYCCRDQQIKQTNKCKSLLWKWDLKDLRYWLLQSTCISMQPRKPQISNFKTVRTHTKMTHKIYKGKQIVRKLYSNTERKKKTWEGKKGGGRGAGTKSVFSIPWLEDNLIRELP